MNSLNKQEYLFKIIERLKKNDFAIQNNIKYDDQGFEYIANKTSYERDRLRFSTVFVFSKVSNPDIHSLKDFSAKSFKYAKKLSGYYFPRRLLFSLLCFPVAIVETIDDNTIKFINLTVPPKHFAAFEKLVVFSLETNKLYYCEITPNWGSLYFERDRQTINELLAP